MRPIRVFQLTFLFTVLIFSSVLYTSCKKDPCEVYNCYNNGTCSNGQCVCPTGFIGLHCETPAPVKVTFTNNAILPAHIIMNDTSKLVNAGQNVSFYATNGQRTYAQISVSQIVSGGTPYGVSPSWTSYINVGAHDTTISINVPNSYYFLQVVNTSSYTITSAIVNQYYSEYNLNITSSSGTVQLGYYSLNNNTTATVELQASSSGKTWTFNPSLSGGVNQMVTVTAN